MAVWKQAQQQPFNTYRDPQTGQWTVLNPSQQLQDIIVEAPVYRDAETGRWITAKSPLPT